MFVRERVSINKVQHVRLTKENPGPLHYGAKSPLPSYNGSGASCTKLKQGLEKKYTIQ